MPGIWFPAVDPVNAAAHENLTIQDQDFFASHFFLSPLPKETSHQARQRIYHETASYAIRQSAIRCI
jgi:hypothetical protein